MSHDKISLYETGKILASKKLANPLHFVNRWCDWMTDYVGNISAILKQTFVQGSKDFVQCSVSIYHFKLVMHGTTSPESVLSYITLTKTSKVKFLIPEFKGRGRPQDPSTTTQSEPDNTFDIRGWPWQRLLQLVFIRRGEFLWTKFYLKSLPQHLVVCT